jgi:membrane-associated protease RseP (regulator of RpoE activity)
MPRISILILYIILFSGCAELQTQRAPEGNFVAVARIGVQVEVSNNKIVVKMLTEGYPAETSGVKPGDIIVSVDGKIITTEKEFLSIIDNKRSGDHVLLAINRNGQQISFNIEPKVVKLRKTLMTIRKLLLEDNKVAIAIIVREVKNSFPNVAMDWANSIRNNLQTREESGLLSAFGKNANFSVVDRSRLKQILDEFQFSQMGLVSDKLRAKIGEMTGATHIQDISFSRFQGRTPKDKDDVYNARLIEIESGKVLAADQIITH